MTNQEIINPIKYDVEKEILTSFSKKSYNFMGLKDDELRVPNEKEKKFWLKDKFNFLHHANRNLISTAQYRTLKGCVRKGNLEDAFKFLTKKGFTNIESDYKKFCETRNFATIPIIIPVKEPVKVETFDVYVENKR